MTKQEVLDKLLQDVKFESWPKRDSGGQNCGIIETGVKLICTETSFEVAISYYRQVNKNREMALELYRIYITKLLDESY
jgi:hypothetical protein